MIDEQTRKKYVETPNFCPYCNSSEITAQDSEFEDLICLQVIECETCGKRWREILSVTDVEEIENYAVNDAIETNKEVGVVSNQEESINPAEKFFSSVWCYKDILAQAKSKGIELTPTQAKRLSEKIAEVLEESLRKEGELVIGEFWGWDDLKHK